MTQPDPATILLATVPEPSCDELRTLIEARGHRVIEALSTDGLLRLLKPPGTVELVIIGLGFGHEAQLALVGQIRAVAPTMPVVGVLPRERAADERIALLENGMDGYLLHPLEPREVAATVHALLRLVRAHAGPRCGEQLAERQVAELNIIYNTAPVGLCVLDSEGRYVRINQRLAEMNGYPPGAHVGRTVREMVPHIAAQTEWALRQVLVSGEPLLGIEIVGETAAQPGVQRVWVENSYPLRDAAGHVVGVNIMAEEVTERKRAGRLLTLRARASTALSDALDVAAVLEAVGRLAVPEIADWALLEAFGSELIPDHVVAVHADPTKAAYAREATYRYAPERDPAHPFARVIATGRAELLPDISPTLLRQLARDTEHLTWLHSLKVKSGIIVPLVARGRNVGILALATAESNRRYTEHDVALAEELAHCAAVAVDTARLYEQLLEEARRKDEFLAMLAHELRNPLAPILNAVTVLDRVGGQVPDLARLRSIIGRQTRHLARLVDDLLDVARLASGKVALHRAPLDLREAARRALESLRQAGRAQAHDVTISLPATPVVVEADALRVEQVLGNLLDNAVKYTPSGRAIRVTVLREAAVGVVRVMDEGVGMDPVLLRSIFEPFVQAKQPAARPHGGLGLGLTLVRGLVEQHGGVVTATSAGAGHGSEFTVRLPLALQAESPSAVVPAAGNTSRPLNVVVIEDNEDARAALCALLESEGHRVASAGEGDAGLQLVAAARPDVVIVDIGLPLMDGYEVARRLRESMRHDVRLVALTGYGQPEDQRRAAEAGFDVHIVKPVDIEDLARALIL